MSKLGSALVDLFAGIVILAVAYLDVEVLLQSSRLIYLFFPLLITAAFLVGLWRGAKSAMPAVVIAILATIPLAAVSAVFFTGRNKPLLSLPMATLLFVAIGIAFARARAGRAIAVALLVVADLATPFCGPALVRYATPASDVNEAAVPFTIKLVDGRTITSNDLRGKIVVLDFWATWCTPCQRELPGVQRAHDAMKGRPDVVFIAVDGVMADTPSEADTAANATNYFRRAGLTIPLAWDGGAVLEKAFTIHGFPTLLVLDRQGRVRMRHVGYVGAEKIEETLAAKVAELERQP